MTEKTVRKVSELIQFAREEHTTDELEIDMDAKHSISMDISESGTACGLWVQSWLYVPIDDETETIEDDTEPIPKRRITVVMEGGIIQSIEGIPDDVMIEVWDYDVDGAEADAITALENGDECILSEWGGGDA